VKWKLTATATTENRSTTKHTGIQRRTCGTLEKELLPFKQNYLPQVLLISDEFEIPQLNRTRKNGRYFLTIMMIQRKDTCDVFAGCSEFVQ
jgi:hypothetical protein